MLLDFVEMRNAVVPADVLHDVLVVDALDQKDSSVCHSAHLNPVSRGNGQLVFREHRRDDVLTPTGQAYEYPVF